MGFQLRKKRTNKKERFSKSTSTLSTTTTSASTSSNYSLRSSKPTNHADTTNQQRSPRGTVRTSVLCNSENLDRLYLELGQQQQQQQQVPSQSVVVKKSPSKRREHPYHPTEDLWAPDKLQAAIDQWQLNDQQVAQLKEMQLYLQQDCAHHFKFDPHIVLRFMLSPVKRPDPPAELFRKMIQWRIENNIDTFLETYKPPQILLDYNPTAILKGYDRDGDPIYIERGGNTDASGMIQRFSMEELMQFAIYIRELHTRGEWLTEYEQTMGRRVKDVTVVYDLKGLNASHLSPKVLDFFKQLVHLTQEKYPGPIKRVIIIRAPAIFRMVWNVIKHIFAEKTREKMSIAGKNYLKDLEKYMDLEVLPPCIYPEGKGEAAVGLPPNMEGGMIPNDVWPEETADAEEELSSVASSLSEGTPAPGSPSFKTMESFSSNSSIAHHQEESISAVYVDPPQECVLQI